MAAWQSIGVDWDSGIWLAVGITVDGSFEAQAYDRISELWDDVRATADRIIVDVPIGLCGSADEPGGCVVDADGELFRECDRQARAVIGDRRSSVFTPPCTCAARMAVDEEEYTLIDGSYAEANECNRKQTGKGLMQQALYLSPGIVEVQDLLCDGPADPERLLEGHPEVCFRALADTDLAYSKPTAPGVNERLALLERTDEYLPRTWRGLASELADEGHIAGTDDLLDAIVLAITASAGDDQLQFLPPESPPDASLPMQIAYRRSEPFDVEG